MGSRVDMTSIVLESSVEEHDAGDEIQRLKQYRQDLCISGKVLPTTINIKPTPHERMINKLQVSTSCKKFVISKYSPVIQTISMSKI